MNENKYKVKYEIELMFVYLFVKMCTINLFFPPLPTNFGRRCPLEKNGDSLQSMVNREKTFCFVSDASQFHIC